MECIKDKTDTIKKQVKKMLNKVLISEVIDKDDIVYIDVRSPKEYEEDHVPGAYNMPIFTDEEREEIGYIYKQVDAEKAKELGLKYAASRLYDYYMKIKEITGKNKKVAIYCFRGGMRSNSIAQVLSMMGLEVNLIIGGYKSYRKYVSDWLSKYNKDIKLVVLHGYTGVAKTKILNILEQKGYPVLNIEKMARNSGSVFGSIAFDKDSSSQKYFESKLYSALKEMDSDYYFTESESKRIGKVVMPEFLYDKLINGKHILLKTDINNRVQVALEDYIKDDENNEELLISAISKLKNKLGANNLSEYINRIKSKDYEYVIKELMQKYYDPLYDYSIDKIEQYDKIVMYDKIDDAIKQLELYASEYRL
ncbi:tRNA 2-selenouridine(34) synthase MnmH [Clostridiaceae bacterium M8S5]|nr:tRNA 2-selenouridine(34) synthase MnmH [Clostridiaceae bacterium M8S5]